MSSTDDTNSKKDDDKDLLKEDTVNSNVESTSTDPGSCLGAKSETLVEKRIDKASGDATSDISSENLEKLSKEFLGTIEERLSDMFQDEDAPAASHNPTITKLVQHSNLSSPKSDKQNVDDDDDDELVLKWDDDGPEIDTLDSSKENISEDQLLADLNDTEDNQTPENDKNGADLQLTTITNLDDTNTGLESENLSPKDSHVEEVTPESEEQLLLESPSPEVPMEADNKTLDEPHTSIPVAQTLESKEPAMDHDLQPNITESNDFEDQNSPFKLDSNINLDSPMKTNESLDSPLRLESDSPIPGSCNMDQKSEISSEIGIKETKIHSKTESLINVEPDTTKDDNNEVNNEIENKTSIIEPKKDVIEHSSTNLSKIDDTDNVPMDISSNEIDSQNNLNKEENIVADTSVKELITSETTKEDVNIDNTASNLTVKDTHITESDSTKETEIILTKDVEKVISENIPTEHISSKEVNALSKDKDTSTKIIEESSISKDSADSNKIPVHEETITSKADFTLPSKNTDLTEMNMEPTVSKESTDSNEVPVQEINIEPTISKKPTESNKIPVQDIDMESTPSKEPTDSNKITAQEINTESTISKESTDSNKIPVQDIDMESTPSKELIEIPVQASSPDKAKESTISKDSTEIPVQISPEKSKCLINVRTDLFMEKSTEIPSSTPTKNKTTDDNQSISKFDNSLNSSKYITEHRLQKPDAMLEIPTQELIDLNDSEFSMNLDTTSDVNNSANDMNIEITDVDKDSKDKGKDIQSLDDIQASTSKNPVTFTPDTSDEVPEMEDSLGLLAESSARRLEDDDEPDDDDDVDDDDDYDQDESSNQVSAEHSEDSNTAPSETEPTAQDDIDPSDGLVKDTTMEVAAGDTLEQQDGGKATVSEDKDVPESKKYAEECKKAAEELEKIIKGEEETEKVPAVKLASELEQSQATDTSDDAQQKIQDGRKERNEQSPDRSEMASSKESPNKLKNLQISTPSKVLNIVELEESSSEEVTEEETSAPKRKTKAQKGLWTSDQMECAVNMVRSGILSVYSAAHRYNVPRTVLRSHLQVDSTDLDDNVEEVKSPSEEPSEPPPSNDDVTVKIPTAVEVMSSGENTSEITTQEGEVVISGVPKKQAPKVARLNTSEVTIKTVVVPEAKVAETPAKSKLSLEIFSLDSDEEDSSAAKADAKEAPSPIPDSPKPAKKSQSNKCINSACASGGGARYVRACASAAAYYDVRARRPLLCEPCAAALALRTQSLVSGIRRGAPLLALDTCRVAQELVRISDSESDDERPPEHTPQAIGARGARLLEESLADLFNDTWKKYSLDERLKDTKVTLDAEMEKMEKESQEIDRMLRDCQTATDKLRNELYATFEHRRKELPGFVIIDTKNQQYSGPEIFDPTKQDQAETRQSKRRGSTSNEPAAKRPAIPLGYAPLDNTGASQDTQESKANTPTTVDNKMEDDKDISVVQLSAEAAPPGLPPPGEVCRPPLRLGQQVYAMKNAFGPWLRGKVVELQTKAANPSLPFTMCRVKFEHKMKVNTKVLPARCIAYSEPAEVRMTIGTRLIALFKDANSREAYYSGVVAELPNPVNNYRYLVFFDDGYAQYVSHTYTRLVCESSQLVWEEVHPFSREFVKEYLLAYPERPMVRLHEGQHLKTEWNGKWWSSKVIKVDASLARVKFIDDGRCEWIYRGSTRLAPLYLELKAAERHRPRPMTRRANTMANMPYVEYTRSDEQAKNQTDAQSQQNEEIRRQRAVAKKSTAAAGGTGSVPSPHGLPPPRAAGNQMHGMDPMRGCSRVVYYTPKNAVKPYKMVPHTCGPQCKRTDLLSLKELRTYNPLAKPLLSGWERQVVRFRGAKAVLYRAPCGRRVRSLRELHRYLRTTRSDLPVDLFDFHPDIHCLAEFVLNKCIVGKKDLSHGKENVPVPCVNYYDETLPEFCSYNTERTPTAGVPLNLDPAFLCGCDCTDDCEDKSKCACWQLTLEGARTIHAEGPTHGYVYKRLPVPLPSGIYECNSRCKCKQTCLNRVAQHPLQLKLQVFKTLNRGWGIRALNDVPKGSFLCVYAGNLLTDATANLDGLNEGDEYLAELDYIEVVEQMKEGYEDDVPEADKKLDKKEAEETSEEDEEDESSAEDDEGSKSDQQDDDFRPTQAIGLGVMEFNKRLRKRDKKKNKSNKDEEEGDGKEKETKEAKDEELITISDDEEVREPLRFTAQAGMGSDFEPKYRSVRSYFGKDEACYIMDAKVQGNIGRYLNHSCSPNVFVQNVFVDTHDPRFPWVAFFALSHIKAGSELTWNYNYDVGSVPDKVLYCYCGAPNCRGRLL